MFLSAVLPALIFGMESADFKDVVMTLGGFAILYLQYLNNKKADAAKDAASKAVDVAVNTGEVAAASRAEMNEEIKTLASNVDGKMKQLLDATASAAKQEGKEEGRQEASGKSEDLRTVVTDAMVDAAPKAAEVAAPVLAKALKDELKAAIPKPPDDPTGATPGP